jgi:hypothetical protein
MPQSQAVTILLVSDAASVTLLSLFGEIVLSAAEGQTALPLTLGTGAVFAAHLTHRAEARQDNAFVLVMGGQA